MRIRLASTLLLASLCLSVAASSTASVTTPIPAQSAMAQVAPPSPETLAVWQVGAQWIAALALLGGVITAAAGIHQYIDQSKRQRRERARSVVQEFSFLESIRNVSDILDYEEYRTFKTTLRDGRTIHFEATDGRLKRALRPHGEMLKTQQGIKMLSQLSAQGKMDENTARVLQKYRDEEFAIELALRGWFDDFLGALEAADNAINAGIVNSEDIKPFVSYWIRVIGDRRYRRQGGSGFYDQLFHYIVNSGFEGVQRLFERYGYKILPPPYSTNDFNNIEKESPVFESFRALCMAKAAHLVYEDQEYVEDIVRDWLSDEVVDDVWRKQNPADYVVDVIKFWLREGDRRHVVEIKGSFKYFADTRTDTQAFMFKKGNHIVLVFRGSQQVADWKTNFSFRLRLFAVYDMEKATDELPTGKVHRGFQDAWESIERRVVAQLRKWWTPESYFWVTGHSLGGALASLAAASLEYQGFKVNGLYTFGQPRVGEWKFVRQVNTKMGKRMVRYVNNNDVVPMVPPQINLLDPTKLYGHMGQFRYFNAQGNLRKQSVLGQRWGDRLLGFLISLREPGLDIIADHMMEFYVRNLQRALDKEKDLQKAQQEEAMNAAELYEIEKAR